MHAYSSMYTHVVALRARAARSSLRHTSQFYTVYSACALRARRTRIAEILEACDDFASIKGNFTEASLADPSYCAVLRQCTSCFRRQTRSAFANAIKRMSTSDQVQNAASISTAKLATSVKKDTTVKFRSAGQPAGITSKMLGDNRYSPNPAPAASDPFVNFSPSKMHKLEQEDQRSSISDTDDSCSVQLDQTPGKPLPAPGKKTRGRVKIQMEYIQNKLRRYTTFSKRKSGMMKKVSFRLAN